MTLGREQDPADGVTRILRALLESFDSYHSNIREQTALVDSLIAAVQGEERARCLAIARRGAVGAPSADARQTAEAIAAEIGGQ